MRHNKTKYWLIACGLSAGLCAAPAGAQVRDERRPIGDDRPEKPAQTEAEDDAVIAPRDDAEHADSLADLAERAAQRVTALELEQELAALLGPDGLPIELGSGPVRDALLDVAARCDLLAHILAEPIAQEVLVESQARVYNALVQDASAQGESAQVARGLRQLRTAAHQLNDLDTPHANVAGAYWLMLADLIDANRTITGSADRRVFVRELLSRFLEDHPAEPLDEIGTQEADARITSGYVFDARVALSHLLDEAGEQAAAIQALGVFAQMDPDDPRYEQVRSVISHHGLIGQPIEIELPTSTGDTWRLSDYAGRPVLVHVFAQGVGNSGGSIFALRRVIANAQLGGYSVVSLHVGELIPQHALPPWPTALVAPDQRAVLDALGADAVPMYVWIDAQGQVASIGKTLDVVRQFPEPAQDTLPNAAEDQAPQAAAPGDSPDPAAEGDGADPDPAAPATGIRDDR